MNSTGGKCCGIWIRVSTEDQAKGESPEHHERRARFYAESKGWVVREVYHLEAVSGKSVMNHPEAQRMLKDVRAGHITGLIFSKLARLARNTKELLEFADIFREQGADLVSLQESIDTSTPVGRFFYTLIAAMAAWEREEIADRVAASVPIRAKLGKPLGGAAPFGYRWENRKLVVNPDEAPIRRRVHELFAEHERKKRVARLLNEAGYRTRSGKQFSDVTVEVMLRDPTAKGLRRANYSRLVGGTRKVLKPQDEWVHIPVEAIVSEDLWDRCNRILDDQRAGRRPAGPKPLHTFAGLVYCTCGTRMYVFSNWPKYICKNCKTKITIEDLEEVYRAHLRQFLFSPQDVVRFVEESDRAIQEKLALLDTLSGELGKIQTEMDRLYRLYVADQVTVEGFGERNRPLEERRRQLQDEVPRLQGEIDFLKIQHLSSNEVLSEAQDISARWPDLEQAERRKIVETITERITVGKEEISLEFAYLPSLSESTKRQSNLTDGYGRG